MPKETALKWIAAVRALAKTGMRAKIRHELLGKPNAYLGSQQITDVELELIARRLSQAKINLLLLDLSYNSITFLGMTHLASVKWSKLTLLNLDNNQLGAVGCRYLSIAVFPELRTLLLCRNQIGDVGLFHLCKANLKKLQVLTLESNMIAGEGFRFLCKSNWSGLKLINLWHNGCKTHQLLGFLAYESSKSTKLMVNLDKYNLINYKQLLRLNVLTHNNLVFN